MANIKPPVKEIIGKRISGLVIKEATSRIRTPRNQLFFLFDDGTYYEFYTFDCEIGTTAGLSRGGLDKVLPYMADVYTPIFVEKEDINSHASYQAINISDKADNETRKLYGEPPKNPALAGYSVLLILGAAVPLCLPVIDAIAYYFFGHELLARNAPVTSIFLTLGIVAGAGVYLYQNRVRHKWYARNVEIYQRLQNEHKTPK